MPNLSDVVGGGIASMAEEHGGGKRKERGKSRESARAREGLNDMETFLAKVELVLIENEEKFEEFDTHIEKLDTGMEVFQKGMQDVLNSAIEKLESETESLRHAQSKDNAAIREEN